STVTSSPERGYGNGFSRTPSITLKMAVLAPIPSASVNTVMPVMTGIRARLRRSCFSRMRNTYGVRRRRFPQTWSECRVRGTCALRIRGQGEPDDEPVLLDDPHGSAPGRDAEAFPEIVEADPCRCARPGSRPEIVLEHQHSVGDANAYVERIVRAGGVVLQSVLEELGQRNRRQEEPAGVLRWNVDREPHASGITDVGKSPVAFERLELVTQRNEGGAAALENVAIGRAQRADERRGRVAALIDEVHERVQVVEEEVRIDLPSQAFELGLEARLFQPCAAQAIALPVTQQEHGLVDVGDGDDQGHDRKQGRGERVLTGARIAGHR